MNATHHGHEWRVLNSVLCFLLEFVERSALTETGKLTERHGQGEITEYLGDSAAHILKVERNLKRSDLVDGPFLSWRISIRSFSRWFESPAIPLNSAIAVLSQCASAAAPETWPLIAIVWSIPFNRHLRASLSAPHSS